jgi:hypothetical protein
MEADLEHRIPLIRRFFIEFWSLNFGISLVIGIWTFVFPVTHPSGTLNTLMSILVTCQCGKHFKTGDQYAGKKARCPGCGTPLTIPAAPPKAGAPLVRPRPPTEASDDLLSLAEPEVFQPSSSIETSANVSAPKKKSAAAAAVPPLSKSNRKSGPVAVPRITMSPGIIVLIVLAILIPAGIYWAKEGPMKAQAEWAKMSDTASENIVGQITRAIQEEYKNAGRDLNDMAFRPKATNAFFDTQGMMLSMPETVSFQGSSTEGHFSGKFHPHTWRFEADAPVRTSPTLLKITGSASETDQSLDVNGKAVK